MPARAAVVSTGHRLPMHTLPANLESILRHARTDMVAALASWFPDAASPPPTADAVAAWPRGGRRAALEALAAIDPVAYARSRNHVTGATTGLSPWIRHGVLSLAEVRDAAVGRVRQPQDADKLVSELAWRDYWRQVHAAVGDAIHADLESPAAAARRPAELADVPDDVLSAATGMRCIDAFVRKLHDTGRLHNHERMWLASWLVHVRRVRWQAGADWFLRHLVDGDPASNHLSWQWVAGTFAAKPYIFNRENLQTYTDDRHCGDCPLLGRCDVEGSYEDLTLRLFAPDAAASRPALRIRPTPTPRSGADATPARPLVWLTLDSAASTSPAAAAHADAPRVFVIDSAWLRDERPTLKRLVFLCECLADVPGLTLEIGDPATILPRRARAAGCDGIACAETPCPRIRRAIATIAREMPVAVEPWPGFCDRSRVDDLGRFSRYWNRVRASALRPTGGASTAAP